MVWNIHQKHNSIQMSMIQDHFQKYIDGIPDEAYSLHNLLRTFDLAMQLFTSFWY